MVVFAALVLWLRHDLLPHADRHRARIVASIEKASGMAVTVDSIRGGWGGLRPVLDLRGLKLADRRGKAAFELERAEVSVSWWSLFAGQLRFQDVDLYRPQLELRRGADGLIYLADKPLNEAGRTDDGAFTEWLLAQPRLAIHDASLVWRDDFLGLPEVALRRVEIAVERGHGQHRAALTAQPPANLASRIDLRASVRLARRGAHWVAEGDAFAEAFDANLESLRVHLPIPETLRTGVGSVRVWGQFEADTVREVTADLNVRDARARLAADVLPLELASLSGRATYRQKADGFAFTTEGLRFRLASGLEAEPGRFSLERSAPAKQARRMQVNADNIDLKIAAALLDYFPLPREVKGQVVRFAPRGRIRDAALSWSEGGPRTYSVRGRFEDLSVNAVEGLPGLEGFDGTIEGSEAGGTLTLDTKQASVDLSRLFRDPLVLDTLRLKARWKPAGDALEVALDDVRFANADTEGRFAGTWRSLPGTAHVFPGFVDLKGSLARADAAAVHRYVPERLAPTRDWLQRAVTTGEVSNATFTLQGDLYQFPFGPPHEGLFLVEGDIAGGQLKYHPDWPSIDAIQGHVRFENRRMEIRAERAAIFASRVQEASAVIEDFAQRPVQLAIRGAVDTTGGDSMRFLRESPLVNGPGAFTRVVSVEGPARLKLRIDWPMGSPEGMRIVGDYTFNGATATTAKSLAMRDLKGLLTFTERSVKAQEIAGTIFGKPATLSMASSDTGVVTTLEGRIDAPVLASYVPEAFSARLTGGLDWKARVSSSAAGTDLLVTSDLKGLASQLPEPLAKKADDARAITLAMTALGTEREVTRVSLAGGAHGRFNRRGDRWQAAVRFGAPIAAEPQRDDLWLYGELEALDVDAWRAVFATPATAVPAQSAPPATQGEGVALRGLDLRLGRARFMSREFRDLSARLERTEARWSGRLESPLIAGDVTWDPTGAGRLHGRLQRLAIPEAAATPPGAAPPPAATQQDLPAIDVVAERFDFRGKALGRLTLEARPAGEEWRIDRLDIASAAATMSSTGVWRRTGTGSLTTLDLKLDVGNMNGLFATFGYGDYLKRGNGHLTAALAWPGLPHEFNVALLAGTMKVEAKQGQFAKIDPGAGKLLGLLSLQSLPRRVSLDFRDVFSEGFAFEKIQGDVKVARGVLLTDDFEISGPAAFVSLSGEVSLPQETQALTMKVVPEVSESMALAATLVGTPVLGLTTLLVSKLLNNPFGKVVAYEYQVTGSWDNPVVSRTSAATAARAAQAAAPAPAR